MTTYKGQWWIPHANDHSLFGTLTYDRYDGMILELSGTLSSTGKGSLASYIQSWGIAEQCEPLIVHGQAQDGTCFTLYDGFVKSSSCNASGLTTEQLFFNRGIRGAWITDPSALLIDKVYARYYGLEPWLSVNPFDVQYQHEPSRRLTAVYEMPAPIRTQIDEHRTCLVAWNCRGPAMSIVQTELSISSTPSLGIEYARTVGLDDALADTAVLSDLLTLLFGAPTSGYDIEFRSPDATKTIGGKEHRVPLHFMAAHFRIKKSLEKWTPHDVLLPLPKIRDRFDQVLSKWFNLRAQCWGAIVPYFSSQRLPAPLAEGRFFEYARAAESIHRNLRPDEKAFPDLESREIRDTMMAVVPAARKEYVGSRLIHLNDLTYLNRLVGLMERFPDLISHVVGDADAQRKFAQRVKALRNIEAHLLDRKERDKLDGLTLVRIAAKLKVLIDAWLLAEIGIPEEQISQAMRGNREYWHYASNDSCPWDK